MAPLRYYEITEGIIMHPIHSMPITGIGRISRPLVAEPARQRGAISTRTKRPLVQPFVRIATVGALALLLAGSGAITAEAKPREGANRANGLILMCLSAGYDPFVFEFVWGTVAVGCPDLTDEVVTYATSGGASARAMAAEDSGNGAAAADHGQQKAKKPQKHKAHAKKHGKHGKR